jgi:imidazole glycerol-phosphate synthase subunit HisH
MTTVVIDHGRANLFSLCHALKHLEIPFAVSAEPGGIAAATRIFLPGVGAFGDVMKGLRERGLVAPLLEAIARRVPTLGICVGMQILSEGSEEFGRHPGLAVLDGRVRRLPDLPAGERGIRVPNVGWRALKPRAGDPVLGDLAPETMTYFVHSYAFGPARASDVAATIDFNGRAIAAVVRRGSVMGFQFHPEKSGPAGLALIRRFMALGPGAN